ncbi:MAG: hypothetical protein AB8H03_07410 [Saprospiraceae bacterium]
MKKITPILIGSFFLLIFISCKTTSSVPLTAEVKYLSNPSSGLISIQSVGYGKDDKVAKKNAFQTAFNTILFKGLPGFSALKNPLINDETKARRANPKYFKTLFEENGYLQFVTNQEVTELLGKGDTKKSRIVKQTFTINYKLLRRHLEQNNIIRKFGL